MINAHVEMDLNHHVSVVSSKIIQLVKADTRNINEKIYEDIRILHS